MEQAIKSNARKAPKALVDKLISMGALYIGEDGEIHASNPGVYPPKKE